MVAAIELSSQYSETVDVMNGGVTVRFDALTHAAHIAVIATDLAHDHTNTYKVHFLIASDPEDCRTGRDAMHKTTQLLQKSANK